VISCGRQRILRRLAEQWRMRDSLEYVSFRWITYRLALFLGPIVLVTVALVTPDPWAVPAFFVTIVVICVVGVLLTLRFVVEE
jgi:VIT1/CCC1 family predicted Fe2+/Mn2+ transporter